MFVTSYGAHTHKFLHTFFEFNVTNDIKFFDLLLSMNDSFKIVFVIIVVINQIIRTVSDSAITVVLLTDVISKAISAA